MNPKSEFLEHCKKLVKPYADPALLEAPPNNISDLALPCFTLSKKHRKNPAAIATEIALKLSKKIKKDGIVQDVKALGPYVNFYVNNEKFSKLVTSTILKQKKIYGSGKKKKEKIMIEYAQLNTHKAVHIGHVRNMSLGESIARIFDFSGYKTLRVSFPGDIGPHVAKCIWGYQHLGMKEPTTEVEKGKWLGLLYSEASKKAKEDLIIAEQISEVNRKLYENDKQMIALWKKTKLWSLKYLDSVFLDFGIKLDKIYFESQSLKPGMKMVKLLVKKKKAKISDGATIVELGEKLGNFVILKSDGTPLYSTKDLGLVQMQLKDFKPDRILHVVAEEQDLYFRQLFETFKMINKKWYEKSKHVSYGLVVSKAGKMSSREGDVILYSDLLEKLYYKALETATEKDQSNIKETAREIALAAMKYAMLKIDSQKTITFDWEEALSIEGDTGPYLQYTHARANSILEKTKNHKPKKSKSLNLEEKEILLAKKLADFPLMVDKACREVRPNIIANYLHELSATFNEFYQTTRVIDSENETFRIELVKAFKITLANGLDLLGITPLEKI